ncbi:hypothetical protein [Pelagicoccus sp. SDUM812002]|nr:hypothetical protein [Pelagicoccus sp. SDUM812002]
MKIPKKRFLHLVFLALALWSYLEHQAHASPEKPHLNDSSAN